MAFSFLSALTATAPRLKTDAGHTPAMAVFMAAAGLAAASVAYMVAGLLAVFGAVFWFQLPPGEQDVLANMATQPGQFTVVAQQALVVLLVVALVFLFQSKAIRSIFQLPAQRNVLLPALCLVLLVSFVYAGVLLFFVPEVILNDLKPFIEALKSNSWILLAVAVCIGAPLSEEFMFRGFLFSALASSPLGVLGATLVTNTAWTALHSQYSIYGLIDIFLIGLVLSWLVWRTGSVWVSVFCHAIYNTIVFFGLLAYVNIG